MVVRSPTLWYGLMGRGGSIRGPEGCRRELRWVGIFDAVGRYVFDRLNLRCGRKWRFFVYLRRYGLRNRGKTSTSFLLCVK